VNLVPGRSLWSDTLPEAERAIARPLDGDVAVDVAIVGAGLTGLWTAWYLLESDPSLRITIVERDTIGFGASGRNGGWCSALLPMSHTRLTRRHGLAATVRMQRAMHANVAAIGEFVDRAAGPASGILHRGGTVDLARNVPQQHRLTAEVAHLHGLGFDGDDYRWLDAADVGEHCRATDVLGAIWTPHCATVHPLRLTHLVARSVLAAGATVHEHTTAIRIADGRVVTDRGTVRADVVIRATEGYTSQLPGERRSVLPLYSLMIATEPLGDAAWDEIGLAGRPTFADGRHMVIYGQRTADGRLAFGGRGAPYHWGSSIRPEFDTDDRVRELLTTSLHELFPATRSAAVTHHWGGVLGAPRDWTCSVRFDRRTGFGTAGGYVGDGVGTTHLAGRTLAALVTGRRDDELLRLPWVGHRSRRWEPEPLRWLGVNLGRTAAARADATERRSGRPSRWWSWVMGSLVRR
jgi:glycine/D-amino acid oxidase-like deaminating enzyme